MVDLTNDTMPLRFDDINGLIILGTWTGKCPIVRDDMSRVIGMRHSFNILHESLLFLAVLLYHYYLQLNVVFFTQRGTRRHNSPTF